MLKSNPEKDKNNSARKILKRQLGNLPSVEYYYCQMNQPIKKIIVLVHGISRNAEEIMRSFSQVIDDTSLLVAPVFSREYARDYQRLGRKGKGPRADYILQSILNELKDEYDCKLRKINLFGFSAGAQFSHRFAFAHPHLIDKVAIVAAGWYTLPSKALDYPMGLKLNGEFTDVQFELARISRIKFRVYIGEKDYLRDKSLNKNKKIDRLQGKNRIERAKNWIDLMRIQAEKQHISNAIKLELLPSVAHDFTDANNQSEICTKVYEWFIK